MKNRQSYLVLLFAFLLCGSLQAKVNNYVGGYAAVGEWSLMPSGSDYSASLGASGGLGFLYELQAGKRYAPARFLFDVGVGASYGMTSYSQSSDRTEALTGQFDLNGDRFDYIYELQGRRDKYSNLAVQLPVLFGFQYKRFYMLAGVKVYANMWTQSHSTATLNTYGRYESFDEFRNMPKYQFFTDEPVSGGVKTSLNLDMDLSLEIGARLGGIYYGTGYDVPKRLVEYRLAAFVDYGLLDLHTKGTQQSLILPETYDTNPQSENYVYNSRTMVDNLVMNDIMSTDGFASAVKNLVVGVKFTVLFQLPEPGQCVICRDGYQGLNFNGGGGRGVKYEE